MTKEQPRRQTAIKAKSTDHIAKILKELKSNWATVALVVVTIALVWATLQLADVTDNLNYEKPHLFTQIVPNDPQAGILKLSGPEEHGNIWLFNDGKFDIYIHESIDLFIECDGKKTNIGQAQLQADPKQPISNLLSTELKRRYYSYNLNLKNVEFSNGYRINKSSHCRFIVDDMTNSPLLPVKGEIEMKIGYSP